MIHLPFSFLFSFSQGGARLGEGRAWERLQHDERGQAGAQPGGAGILARLDRAPPQEADNWSWGCACVSERGGQHRRSNPAGERGCAANAGRGRVEKEAAGGGGWSVGEWATHALQARGRNGCNYRMGA